MIPSPPAIFQYCGYCPKSTTLPVMFPCFIAMSYNSCFKPVFTKTGLKQLDYPTWAEVTERLFARAPLPNSRFIKFI